MTTQTLSVRPPKPGTSLAETWPAIADRWDYEANAPLTPEDVSYGSSRTASFTCAKGHPAFSARVNSMTRGTAEKPVNGCPVCVVETRRAPRIGRRNLAEEFPEVAAQWDYEANYPLTPEQVAPRSNKKAWFSCPEHGSALVHISNRTAGHGCLECGNASVGQANRDAALKRGSLAETHPGLVAEWDRDLNDLTPEQVAKGTKALAWWNCPKGHAPYQSRVRQRTRGSGCPVCGQLSRLTHLKTYEGPEPGCSLADVRPDLAALWDTDRNEFAASTVSAWSQKLVIWRCNEGHSFEKTVAAMSQRSSCPCCRAAKREARASKRSAPQR